VSEQQVGPRAVLSQLPFCLSAALQERNLLMHTPL
jgi:hypothetical protein